MRFYRWEGLERRHHLSSIFSGHELAVSGTNGSNAIVVNEQLVHDIYKYVVSVNGVIEGGWPIARITRIVVDGRDGNDHIAVFAGDISLSATVYGGRGNDVIDCETTGDVASVYGGAGRDRLFALSSRASLFGNSGPDKLIGDDDPNSNQTLDGGDGNDQLVVAEGVASVQGGNGTDSIVFDTAGLPAPAHVTVQLGVFARFSAPGLAIFLEPQFSLADDIEIVVGTAGNDRLTGTARDETLIGAAGADTIFGGGGLDASDNDPSDELHDISARV